jgi:hypothetical protein
MCKDTCDPAKKYIEEKIMKFKPPGSPPISNMGFLDAQCRRILRHPDSILCVRLSFPYNEHACLMYIKDYDITKIVKQDDKDHE